MIRSRMRYAALTTLLYLLIKVCELGIAALPEVPGGKEVEELNRPNSQGGNDGNIDSLQPSSDNRYRARHRIHSELPARVRD